MTSAATMSSKSFHLRWNNHLTNLRSLLESLYNDQNLVDVTLSCRDGTVRAHKLMLSACSPYFETIFLSHEVEHPVVILKGISQKEMKCLVDYMYVGSLEVSEDELPSLLSVANELQIKGLIQKPSTTTATTSTTKPSSTSSPSHNSSNNEHLYSPLRSSSTDNEDEDVDMMEDRPQHRPVPLPLKVNMPPPHPAVRLSPSPMRMSSPPVVAPKTPSEQTFNNVTQYGGGVVKTPDTLQTESATSIGAAGEDKHYSEDEHQMIIAPDGEILEPMNGHNNNNNGSVHTKSSSQSQYIGHCLDEALSQPDLQCRICKRYFNNRQNLRRHVQTHTGDKPHQCDICFISFLRLSHLQRHIRTHTGEKPYACSLCAKSFSRSDKLKNHYIHQHSEVGAEMTNKKRGRPSKMNFPGLGFQLTNNTLTINNNNNTNTSSGQNENCSPPPPSHLTQSSLEELARSHTQSLFFNSGALSLTPINMSSLSSAGNGGNTSETALSLIVNKSLQQQAYQQIANAISDNVLSIAPIKLENNVKEQLAS